MGHPLTATTLCFDKFSSFIRLTVLSLAFLASACAPSTTKQYQEASHPSQDDRYILNTDNSTLLDTATDLTWTACPVTRSHLSEHCGSGINIITDRTEFVNRSRYFSLGGYDDWRLPTVEEFLSIVECSNSRKHQIDELEKLKLRSESFEICRDSEAALPDIFPESIRKSSFVSGTLIGDNLDIGVVIELGKDNKITRESPEGHRALYVRGALLDPASADETKLAPIDPLQGEKIVFRIGHYSLCEIIAQSSVLKHPHSKASPYDFDSVMEFEILYPVRANRFVDNDRKRYYASRSSQGDIVYLDASYIQSTFSSRERLGFSYTVSDFTPEPFSPSPCMFTLSLYEYNARIAEIEKRKGEVRLAEERKEREEIERRERWLEAQRKRASRPDPEIGMTAEQVRNSTNLGYPDRVNRTTTIDGVSEQWVYRRTRSATYLYFYNGILRAIQD